MNRSLGFALLAAAPLAAAQPDYGLDFVTIGNPGNPGSQWTDFDGLPLGAVDYEYRIMRTELTATQWVDFLIAYEPYADDITDGYSSFLFEDFDTVRPNAVNSPVAVPWLYAARFANWLHNDKGTGPDAFEDGAYDMSTFVDLGSAGWAGEFKHKPDARFWIPTESEWVKAAHWDPNKNGPVEGGYWFSQGQQDGDLVPGLPGEPGAQTSAGLFGPQPAPPVGSYPDVTSAYGLLDTSGGVYEHTENATKSTGRVALRGSRFGDTIWPTSDYLLPSINVS